MILNTYLVNNFEPMINFSLTIQVIIHILLIF